MKAPLLLCFGSYLGDANYEIEFEALPSIESTQRAKRNEELSRFVNIYAKSLEKHVKYAPYNWFNFYRFWSNDTT